MSSATPSSDRAPLLAEVKKAIDANRQNAQKWKPMYEWFGDRFTGVVRRGDVVGKLLTQDKQLTNRLKKELLQLNPTYVVLTALPGVDLDDVRRHLKDAELPNAKATLILQGQTPVELQFYDTPDTVMSALAAAFPELTPVSMAKGGASPSPASSKAAATGVATPVAVVALAIDDRIRRMVELAILSTEAP